jgi:hypothetical protein
MRFLLITCGALVVLVIGACSAAQAAPLKDVDDPFYRYDKPLADIAPGTVLKTRTVGVAPLAVPTPLTATQVLYRTTKTNGAPVATVATIMRPLAANTRQILSYQTAYDDLGSTCVPSYTIQGGSTATTPALEIGFMLAYLAQGFTVVTSDYEGLTHDYTAGQGAGYAVLDSIRATRKLLGAPDPTPVGLVGYSGGAIATEWASEIAPSYAPETSIVGAASGGIPVHFAHTISYIDGTKSWASVIPYLFTGLFRGADVDVTRYLSAKGKEAVKFVSDKCLETGTFPGLHMNEMLADGRDWKSIRPIVKVINTQIMGTAGTPESPVLFGNGNADGIGDGIMISADVEALAHRYCQAGVPVQYTRYPSSDHTLGIPQFEAEAIAFLQARFNGIPMAGNCGSLSPRSALKPLPLPPLPAVILGKVRRTKRGYAFRARLDQDIASKVTVSLYAVRAGTRKRIATLHPRGDLTTASRSIALPLRGGVPGRAYNVVVKATTDQEQISAKTRFRVPGVAMARAHA